MADFISVLPSVILLWKKVIILVTRTRFFMSYSCFFEDASMEFPSYQLWLNKKNYLSKRWAMYCREHKHLFGKVLGKGGAKRHKKILRQLSGYNQAGQERWCEAHFRTHLWRNSRSSQNFLENVIHNAVTYTEHAKRKTATATLYGFGDWRMKNWHDGKTVELASV